jgi:RHS repeat-associated protein
MERKLNCANGHTTQYAYDPVHRLTSVTDPLGHTSNNTYDAAGNKISFADNNGDTTSLTYDSLNRLTGVSYPDQTTVSYTYDAVGNRLAMTDSSGTTGYAYDGLNRLTGVTRPGGQLVQYSYDAVGNRVGMTYPDGKTVSYAYDTVNRLSGVTDWTGNTTRYSYDANSNLANMTYPNGMETGYTYDNGNRLINLVNMDGAGVVSGYAYTLDANGNRLQATETGPGNSSVVTAYGYDVLNRLHTVTSPGSTVTYTYDPMGNRLNMATNTGNASSSIAYTYDAGDQLLSAGGITYTYDNNGNRIERNESGGISLYGYDGAGRLASVSLQGGPLLTFAYDGDGNRLSKAVTSGNTTESNHYVWDVNGGLPQVLTEADNQGTALSLYGLQRISMTGATGGQMYYQYDGLGSVRGLSDTSGNSVSTYSYDAFGKPDLTTGSADNDFLYRAEQQDPETGLIYLRARYYDPSLGRFITRDTFPAEGTLTQGIHRYVYTGNNPVNRIDPTGKLFGADDFTASQLGFILGELGQYGSDVFNNIGAHKTGLAILNPSSSVEVYSAAGAGGAATAVLTVNGAEIGFAYGGPYGSVIGGAAGCYMGVTGTSILKDVVSGKDPDLVQAATNGAIQTTIHTGVNPLPASAAGKGLTKNGMNLFWKGMYSNHKDLFQSPQNKVGKK